MKNFWLQCMKAENEGMESKVLNVKAKAMMVGKVIDDKERNELKDFKTTD